MAAQGSAAHRSSAEHMVDRRLKRRELRWKTYVAVTDVFQKIIISIIGGAIAFIFYIYQANQTESRYYVDVQAQRERADADLRANMFKTLFDAYLKNKLDAAQKVAEKGGSPIDDEALVTNLGQEIMLTDLLARNFETVDVRPLFEELDRRLTDLMRHGPDAREARPGEAKAFSTRQRLRRVAYGATTRQIELLRANAAANVIRMRVEQCQTAPATTPVFRPGDVELPGGTTAFIRGVGDGSVHMTLHIPTADASYLVANQEPEHVFDPPPPTLVPLSVSYFDMPTLENLLLPNGQRVALTVTRSASTDLCRRFGGQMSREDREECDSQARREASAAATCAWADLSITLIPKDYISMRDRPYLSELSKRGSRFNDWLYNLLRGSEPAAAHQ